MIRGSSRDVSIKRMSVSIFKNEVWDVFLDGRKGASESGDSQSRAINSYQEMTCVSVVQKRRLCLFLLFATFRYPGRDTEWLVTQNIPR